MNGSKCLNDRKTTRQASIVYASNPSVLLRPNGRKIEQAGFGKSFLMPALIAVAGLVTLGQCMVFAQARQINETTLIESNGARLFLELRGQSQTAPIMLYLHGGPGSALGILAFRAYVGPELESKYLVAYLNQRGVVSSPPVPDGTQTLANHVADVANIVKYLRSRFPGRRIFLLGHSWGGTLALLSVANHPHLVDGVIDVAGPFNLLADMKASYQETLEWANQQKNAEAVKELRDLGPPPYADFDRQMTLSKWSSQALGGLDKNVSMDKVLSREPYTKFEDSWQNTEIGIAKAMYQELSRVNLDPQLPTLRIPLLVIVGKRDTIVPASELRKGFELYGGPKKWVEMTDSHHLPFVDEPENFVKAVEEFVR